MKHILCFGDSNLFGTNPSGGRWPLEQRWTGLLSRALGNDYRIIEEGLGGRTTCFDDPLEENRNGSLQLPIMLGSHRPLDLVIISLGTNDCKTLFNANARIVAKALEKLALMVKNYPYGEYYPIPQVLVISPIHSGEKVGTSSFASFDQNSHILSKTLAPAIQAMAEKNNLLFLDASLVATSSPIDQLHMDREGHAALAKALLPLIFGWFGDDRAGLVQEEAIVETSSPELSDAKPEIIDDGSVDLVEKNEAAPSPHKRERAPLSFGFFKRRF